MTVLPEWQHFCSYCGYRLIERVDEVTGDRIEECFACAALWINGEED
jgi:hypothetical protein